MGLFKAQIPMVPKETFWPADIVIAPTDPFASVPRAKDASQTTPYPPIQSGKRPAIAVFKVLEPSPKGNIHINYNGAQTVPIASSGLASDAIFELLQALLSRPSRTPLKVVPEKVKPHPPDPGINQACFLRVQCQTFRRRQLPYLSQSCF